MVVVVFAQKIYSRLLMTRELCLQTSLTGKKTGYVPSHCRSTSSLANHWHVLKTNLPVCVSPYSVGMCDVGVGGGRLWNFHVDIVYNMMPEHACICLSINARPRAPQASTEYTHLFPRHVYSVLLIRLVSTFGFFPQRRNHVVWK